jgi:K(+)-stimulated pyrophosphate-energized sodium pump
MPGLGAEALGGFLAGATVSGVLMGMFQNNAGGAWDNAKKSFEKGVEINGEMFYKKSEPHKASVTGDTVGDPFKDTSGPSMNILIKLMSIVSLVIAPTLATLHPKNTTNIEGKEMIKEMLVTKSDTSNTMNVTVTAADKEVVNSAADNLVSALAADNLLKKENYTLSVKKGIITVDGTALKEDAAAKYKSLVDALGVSDIELKNSQK